jgi:predicted transcriptional regulator
MPHHIIAVVMDGSSASQLEAIFGPLEIRVLQALWARQAPACVRELQPDFPGVAYTTLMTTLDRLFRKGTLQRRKSGRAFYYTPKATREQLVSELAGSAFATILQGDHAAARPILSMFVDTVGRRDEALLDELEALVRARRDELKGRQS